MMTTGVGDGELRRALDALEDASVVVLKGKRVVHQDGSIDRGPTALVVRGRSLVRMPDEAGFRDLAPYELEVLIGFAVKGELKLALPWIPGIGQSGQPRPAAVQFEDGTVLAEGMPGYPPKTAIWGL